MHYRVLVETPFKYDDNPPPEWDDPRSPFSARELTEIEEAVELLTEDPNMESELDQFPDHIKNEVLRRVAATVRD